MGVFGHRGVEGVGAGELHWRRKRRELHLSASDDVGVWWSCHADVSVWSSGHDHASLNTALGAVVVRGGRTRAYGIGSV